MLKAVADWFLTIAHQLPFDRGTILPGPDEPTIAARLADEQIYRSLPQWPPHDPELHLDNLALHLRLQSWSLKPASLAD
jgi:hypothetical protein